ncbi:MAG TPA: DAK2 domain-containing protein, partial [Acidimicrobiales bacterium]|nr:DAK2 domain-containing protein [Acidimicrobiales bacterium]
ALTVEAVVAELNERLTDRAAVCRAISHGSLMGARGNSGVILSQILRGIADAFLGDPDGDACTLADGLARATTAAYHAVMRPVEGTILSVVRAAADAATQAARRVEGKARLVDMLDACQTAATIALERTPEQLPVLKAAGVVDAGGAGLVLLLDAFLYIAAGRPLPEPAVAMKGLQEPQPDPVSDLRYEVMYLLEAPDETIPAFRDVWAGVGDSIVVVGGDGLWNCHIHTDDIGAAVEAALDVGRPRQIRVTDLLEQVEEERWVREAAAESSVLSISAEPVGCAVVAVATGEGIGRIFHSLGVHQIVAGGQSMNPSTAQLLQAIDAAPAMDVVILPNNKNIIPVAEQAASVSAKTVRVVPTRGIAEGFAALLEYDPQSGAEDNATTMAEASARVVSGEITRAVRPSACEAGPIKEGDYLGLSRSGIEVVAASAVEAAEDLLAKLVSDGHEIVTIIEGEGATKADTRRITEWLEEHRPGVSSEVHHGGQPLYPYLFSIE